MPWSALTRFGLSLVALIGLALVAIGLATWSAHPQPRLGLTGHPFCTTCLTGQSSRGESPRPYQP